MKPTAVAYPSFHSAGFLKDHAERTLDFYRKNAVDPAGGFFHCLSDDGSIYDKNLRHLVSSCRFIFNFAMSSARTGNADDKALAEHGLMFLEGAHKQADGSYSWEMRSGKVTDPTIMGYGHAFVLLAAACAIKADLSSGRAVLDNVWSLMEDRFWEPAHGAYMDEFTAGFARPSNYRGQNVNMHMCEACIAAWQATGDEKFIDRAKTLARGFALDRSDLTQGLVWEHFTSDWVPDFTYNADKPDDLFRPWGFQPGHQVEWARLLLTLDAIRSEPWYLKRAKSLYDEGLRTGRDTEYGGVYYGVAPDGSICAPSKYYWVQSETIATAWRLFRRTGDARYLEDYENLWRFVWDHFVDHDHGAWYRTLSRDGKKTGTQKSPPGKTDYHTVGVVWDILDNLSEV